MDGKVAYLSSIMVYLHLSSCFEHFVECQKLLKIEKQMPNI